MGCAPLAVHSLPKPPAKGGAPVTPVVGTCSRRSTAIFCNLVLSRTYSLSWGIAISSREQRHQAIFGLGALFALPVLIQLVAYFGQYPNSRRVPKESAPAPGQGWGRSTMCREGGESRHANDIGRWPPNFPSILWFRRHLSWYVAAATGYWPVPTPGGPF
jgi:hypothetical protein